MHKYVLKRMLLMIPVLLGVSFLVFFLINLTPSTPADIILGELAKQPEKDKMNEELGYNRPFMERYVSYIAGLFRGDMGKSYKSSISVFTELTSRLPTTFQLAVYSITLAVILGIPIGIISAVRQYSLFDSTSTVLALIFISMPTFWLGMMMMILFSATLHWLPSFGSASFKHFIMPAIACSGTTLATLIRMTRSTMLEVIRQDYIRTAYAKGAGRSRVILKHAIKNAMIPIITIIGINFGSMMGGAVVTESLFGMSGIGNYMLMSIRNKDIPVVMGAVLMIAVMYSVVLLILDILYAFIDPRIKSQYSKG